MKWHKPKTSYLNWIYCVGKWICFAIWNIWTEDPLMSYTNLPSWYPTWSSMFERARAITSLGADWIVPDGERFFGICSTVTWETKIGWPNLIVRWPVSPSNAQQLPGELSAWMALVGLFLSAISGNPNTERIVLCEVLNSIFNPRYLYRYKVEFDHK